MKRLPINIFVEACFQAFERLRIPYCIMRNAEEVEDGDAHDVDLIVCETKLREAEECIFQIANQQGWKILFRTGSPGDIYNIKCYNFYKILEDGTPALAHIDILASFVWCSHILIDSRHMLEGVDSSTLYHRIAPVPEAVSMLFGRLLYNGYIKRKYTPRVAEVYRIYPEKAIEYMTVFLSRDLSEEVHRLATAEQWESIEALRPRIVSDIRRYANRYRLSYWLYRFRKAMRPIGIVAALQGTDGSGKTTIIDALPQVLSNTWPADGAIRYFHCRPYVLEPSKQEKFGIKKAACTNPHAGKPYGKLKSFAKLCFCVFDYIIGWCGPIHLERAKGHMVIFDRYYYDFYLDKLRYRFNLSDGVIRMMQFFVPKPNITFVLSGEAEPIWQRKQEISLDEVKCQIKLLETHQHLFANPHRIDVVQPIKKVVNDVCVALLETQHQHFCRIKFRSK